MLKQNKGKDFKNIATSKIDSKVPYYTSIKYDGHYVQVIYNAPYDVEFITSGGKHFYLMRMAQYIMENFKESFHIECEFNYDCEGKLGDRGKSAIITTYRTNHAKDILTKGDKHKDNFRVLDRLDMPGITFQHRLESIMKHFYAEEWFTVPVQQLGTLDEGIDLSRDFYKDGYEGAMLKAENHIYQPGKRVNNIIKLKPRLTADLTVISYQEGTGKYEDMLGSLLFEDENGLRVWAGSGLSDDDRNVPGNRYIGRVYEIEYERIDDTYIQPIIKHRRKDKE